MKNKLLNVLVIMPLVIFLLCSETHAQWEREIEVSPPRENVFSLPEAEWKKLVMEGRKVALFYPVTVSDLLIPYQPLKTFFESSPQDPVRRVLYDLGRIVSPFKSIEDVHDWLGLHDYPLSIQIQNPNPLPVLSQAEMSLPMGATIIQTEDGEALTFGCAACHSSDLFGVKVLGLTNRFPRANEFFRMGEKYAPYINSFVFQSLLKTTEGERLMMKKAKKAVTWVGAKQPQVLGLDTSLAQVALSLAKREPDEFASRTLRSKTFPRKNKLETMVADSKPAVWWNVKYKNRWLSDGSIVSGNPIHTNFLWNEIGRGTDLKVLNTWLAQNQDTIKALTAAVFASKSPRYEDFFGIDAIDVPKAQRGERHFVVACQKCHGRYEKDWSESTHTIHTKYHKKTPVMDVGTDPGRYLGMQAFAEDLNRLKISQDIKTVVEPQKGYVPPPLDGIWARWPYFHNNSIPNLCALLTPGSLRPKSYWAGPAKNKKQDFDQNCVGYPLGELTPSEWKKNPEYFYNTQKEGLSNLGHDEKILMKEGKDIFSREEKMELIEFLKTL